MCVLSTECSASALSANDGVNASIGVMLTCWPPSSVYETASRVFQSAMVGSLSELRGQRHQQAVHSGAVDDGHEDVDAPVGAGGRHLGVVGRGPRALGDGEHVEHRDPHAVAVDHGALE